MIDPLAASPKCAEKDAPAHQVINETYHSTIETGQQRDHQVVIKRSRHPNDPRTLVRFENEVKALKAVTNCSYLSRILDSNAIRLTIALRHEHGQSVDQFVSYEMKSTLCVPDGATIWKQMAGALEYLHSRSIIHDDVKPDNIMWSTERQHGVLIDFGAALVDVPDNYFNTSGTPNYVAPEYLHKVKSAKGDVWALGVSMLFVFGYIALPDDEWPLPAVWDEQSDARTEMLQWLSKTETLRAHVSNDKPLLAAMLEEGPQRRIDSFDLSHELELTTLTSR